MENFNFPSILKGNTVCWVSHSRLTDSAPELGLPVTRCHPDGPVVICDLAGPSAPCYPFFVLCLQFWMMSGAFLFWSCPLVVCTSISIFFFLELGISSYDFIGTILYTCDLKVRVHTFPCSLHILQIVCMFLIDLLSERASCLPSFPALFSTDPSCGRLFDPQVYLAYCFVLVSA